MKNIQLETIDAELPGMPEKSELSATMDTFIALHNQILALKGMRRVVESKIIELLQEEKAFKTSRNDGSYRYTVRIKGNSMKLDFNRERIGLHE